MSTTVNKQRPVMTSINELLPFLTSIKPTIIYAIKFGADLLAKDENIFKHYIDVLMNAEFNFDLEGTLVAFDIQVSFTIFTEKNLSIAGIKANLEELLKNSPSMDLIGGYILTGDSDLDDFDYITVTVEDDADKLAILKELDYGLLEYSEIEDGYATTDYEFEYDTCRDINRMCHEILHQRHSKQNKLVGDFQVATYKAIIERLTEGSL